MKYLIALSKIVLTITFLCVFAWAVRHAHNGGKKLGNLTKPIQLFSSIPNTITKVITGFKQLKSYEVEIDSNFREVNKLEENLFSLNASHLDTAYRYDLANLKNGKTLYSWFFKKTQFIGPSEMFSVAHPQNPLLLEDSSLIGMLYDTTILFRLDKKSKLIWRDTSKLYHHSLNLSHDNHIWACAYQNTLTSTIYSNNSTFFRDDVLTKVNVETGEIVFEKSISDILISNGMYNLVHGCTNQVNSKGTDFFHLNDIEPALVDGAFWKKGDLFLSLRNRSVVLLYRPETNKILRMISGPFLAQHDVDIISPHSISIFNNNRVATIGKPPEGESDNTVTSKLALKNSNIIVYNFIDSSFTTPFSNTFEKENIYTSRQGVHTFLSNGNLFVESTETGKIFLFGKDGIILKKYANKPNDGVVEYPHWMRIYENIDFLNQ